MEKVGPPSSATDGVTRAGPGQNAEDGAEVTCHRPDERLKAGMESADGIGARAAFIAFPLAVCANMLPTPIGNAFGSTCSCLGSLCGQVAFSQHAVF